MLHYFIKTAVSVIIIVLVSEISKRSSLFGSLLASLPFVSILSMIWLWKDTQSVEKVSGLSTGIFWMVLPTLPMFLLIPYLMKKQVDFSMALTLGCGLTIILYTAMGFFLKKYGMGV